MDVLTPRQRHKAMKNIKSKNTSIELLLRKALWQRGYRYRKNYKKLPGSPDIALTKYKIAVFCDGELFHGKDWNKKLRPKLLMGNNADFWVHKVDRNIQRDIKNDDALMMMGWTVLHFWGLDIQKDLGKCVKVIENTVKEISNNPDFETEKINIAVSKCKIKE